MKFKTYHALFASALFLPIGLLASDGSSSPSVKLSDPKKPSVIRFYIPDGTLKVIGTDSPDVISVETDAQPDGQTIEVQIATMNGDIVVRKQPGP